MQIGRLMAVWEQVPDLTFAEMREVMDVAERAATEKVLELRKAKFISLGRKRRVTKRKK